MCRLERQLQLEIDACDRAIAEHRVQIDLLEERKKLALQKQQQAQTALSELEAIAIKFKELRDELGLDLNEAIASVFGKLLDEQPEIEEESEPEAEKIEIPQIPVETMDRNKSNEYFKWIDTANPRVGRYYDCQNERTHVVYLGVDSQKEADRLAFRLRSNFPGTSSQIREAKRLDTNLELKVSGLDDLAIDWLVRQDFTKVAYWVFPTDTLAITDSSKYQNSLASAIHQPFIRLGLEVYHTADKKAYTLKSFDKVKATIEREGVAKSAYLMDLEFFEAKAIAS